MGRRPAIAVLMIAALAPAACKQELSSAGPGGSATSAPTSGPTQAPPSPMGPAASPTGAAPAGPGPSVVPASFAPIVKRVDPSVVTIKTLIEQLEPTLFGRYRRRQGEGLGSGFLVDRDGLILTNNHVIDKAKGISVKLSNDKVYPAKVVGTDPRTDIAVIRIEEHNLVPLPLGDSEGLEVGDWVLAIGNPYGLSHTVSAGIIGAKGRTKEDVPLDPAGYYNFLQTDASINPGNSGGPLLNLKGEVVGINTAVKKEGQGLGFAIPINMVKQLLPMLIRDGHVTRSALGVRVFDVRELDAEDRAALKLTTDHGAVVANVDPNGPAARAHVMPDDVILAFDGTSIDKGDQLPWLASTAGVGKTVTLTLSRAGKTLDVKVTLGELAEPAAPER